VLDESPHDMNDLNVAQASGVDVTRVEWLKMVVRKRILAGEYRPGSWIREVELQREFGLSNGPVREALQSAVADGLAERAPFRGVRVIDLSEREIVELFEVRFALLGFAAELAAERAGPDIADGAAALKASLEQAAIENESADLWLRGELSHWVFELAGNARLREAYERPLLQSLLYVAMARQKKGVRAELLAPVFDVIDAVAQRQPVKARRAVRALTLQTLRYLRHGETSC
jgi:DNA-binding GntR family transcriptional regulator